jgi:biopolymer transport protein ExbD
MAMSVGPSEGDDEVVSAINTTPLVDVMLVLLIIFLITIPVVTHTVPVTLPKERNQVEITKPINIILAVTQDGTVWWNQEQLKDNKELLSRLEKTAVQKPQPEIHIRGDEDGKYEAIGRVMYDCQLAGIAKVSFVTQPPPKGG